MNEHTPGQRVTIVDLVSDPFTKAQPGDPADPNGNLLIDDNTETITIWRPNGVIFTPTPTPSHPSIGVYRFAFVLPAATPYPDASLYGVWSWQTSSSGVAQGNGKVGEFLVVPVPGP